MIAHFEYAFFGIRFDKLRECHIEDIDELLEELGVVLRIMQNTDYDILDHRQEDFDADYLKFTKGIADVELQVQDFITASFAKVTSPVNAISLLEQFQVGCPI